MVGNRGQPAPCSSLGPGSTPSWSPSHSWATDLKWSPKLISCLFFLLNFFSPKGDIEDIFPGSTSSLLPDDLTFFQPKWDRLNRKMTIQKKSH